MPIRIFSVTSGSPAYSAGIRPGDLIHSINHEPVLDEIDYQALSASDDLLISIENKHGMRELHIKKQEWVPLGLCLDETETMKPRRCQNHCMFCFIDQLPEGLRNTLYEKDDDWRLSMMMGNYVTLTNVNEQEFSRLLRRKASPIYISVHATDASIRCRMLNNRFAGNLKERLSRLKDGGIQFHCQIVLCPGINDGAILQKTIEDLAEFYPASQSLAIVPVGLTQFREKLPHLSPFNAESAAEIIRLVRKYQDYYLKKIGTRFVYVSDEFFCVSGQKIPESDEYEDYPQIENGVGMLRLLESECKEAYEDLLLSEPLPVCKRRRMIIPTGVSAYPFIQNLVQRFAPPESNIEVLPVVNRFFGETITVTGLIVGQDLLHALAGKNFDQVLLCDTMLRENTDRFLDDITLSDLENELKKPIRIVHNNGDSLIRALWEMEDADV